MKMVDAINYRNIVGDLEKIKNLHLGKKALILGKGESLKEVPAVIPVDFIVLGINDVFKKFSDLDYLFYFDSITYNENKKAIDSLERQGTVIWSAARVPIKSHLKLCAEPAPYGFNLPRIYHSYTSSFLVLQLLIYAGCFEIYLAGIDLVLPKTGKGDYYDGSKAREGKSFIKHLERMRPGFQILADKLPQTQWKGTKIYRISSTSTLTCFEVKELM